MIKLIKYDLLGYIKHLAIVLVIIIIFTALFLTTGNSDSAIRIVGYCMGIGFTSIVVIFTFCVSLFSKDLKEDSGYLIFSTPKSGYEIVGSKLITSLIMMTLVVVVGILGISLILFTILPYEFNGTLRALANVTWNFKIMALVSVILGFLDILVNIYFAITITKVAIRNKRFGGISAFILFVAVNWVTVKIMDGLASAFPQTINMGNKVLDGITTIGSTNGFMNLNIASTIGSIVITVGMFIITGYLLNKKVDI